MQEAFKAGWINDERLWVKMIKDRNLTSHTYDQDFADEIFKRIKMYIPILRSTFDKLSRKL